MTVATTSLRAVAVTAAAIVFAISLPAVAEPPPHAKAHGWRKKNDPSYRGYTGKQWEKDYGVVSGRCNTDAVLAVAGGAIGGVVGARTTNPDSRAVAVIVGTAIGAVLGAKIGREIDRADQACIGHSLELAGDNKAVRWNNAQTGVAYELVPLASDGKNCRNFRLNATRGSASESALRKACRDGQGQWQLLS
jgi:surface antigen